MPILAGDVSPWIHRGLAVRENLERCNRQAGKGVGNSPSATVPGEWARRGAAARRC